jgi:capsular polysaccharide biosynthesis protein
MSYFIEPISFSEHIDYKLPVNYQPEWEHLFKPDYAYKKVKLGARVLRNVFVNHYGLVLKNGVLVKGCAPNIGHGKYDDDNFYYDHWKKASEQWLVAKFGKSIASKRLDDNKTYLVIHSPWFSYYFWITECIPRLLMVKEHLHDLVLIYPENWKNLSFVNETLALFPELEHEIIPRDVHLFVKNLVMPEVKPWTPMIVPDHISQVRKLILGQEMTTWTNEKIYISREDAAYKKVINEKELVEVIDPLGYKILTMSGKSIFQQAKEIHNSSSVIAITGASMANFVFLNPNSRVVDLTNEHYIYDRKYKFHFKKIVDFVGAEYFVFFCKSDDKDGLRDIATRNIEVDLNRLMNIL